ncbi:MAG: 16S rRNA (uracil(1498)-N(3))-methyltransferase [Syntrophales bacterium]|nr:16S rRNA (uracil(1498)-N(3))-methyltransferase [Syntrophales bacterium]
MTHPRIFLPRDMRAGSRHSLHDEDRRYLHSVLRLGVGDAVLLFNGTGIEAEGIIDSLGKREAGVKILRSWVAAAPDMTLILAQALPKAGKMDLIIQKATELGIGRIIPFVSLRSVPRLDKKQESLKQVRWQKIAVEAARQCRRASVPEVSAPLPFGEMLKGAPADAFKVIMWEEETARDIKGLLRGQSSGEGKTCFIVIGPEGGFTAEEIATAAEAGFIAVSMGRNIMRTETAALAVITIIQYEKGKLFDLTEGETEP